MGSSELILWFALLVCAAVALPIKMSLSQPRSFPTFTLLILIPIPLGVGREGASSCVGLSCQLGLNHDSNETRTSK